MLVAVLIREATVFWDEIQNWSRAPAPMIRIGV